MIPNKKISITPELVYSKIKDFLDSKYNDIVCDQDMERKKIMSFFNNIKNDLLEMIKSDNFWKFSMNIDHCDYRNKKGSLCNKRIYIKTDTREFKCAKHISKLKYEPKKKVNENKNLCISLNNKGNSCGKQKVYGDFCNYHYTRSKQYLHYIDMDIYYLLLYDINVEIDLLNKIDIYNNVNIKIDIDEYVNDMIYYHMDTNFLYDKNTVESTTSDFESEIKMKNVATIVSHNKNKFIDISKKVNSTVNDIYDKIEKNNNVLSSKTKNILDLNKVTVKQCLNNGFTIVNDKDYLKDISIYDIYNGKKINTTKLINYYNKLEKLKIYIANNKKYLYLKNFNKNKDKYIKEKYVNILLEYINTRYDSLYDSLYIYEPDHWIYLLDQYKSDIDSIILDFYNIDEKEYIYI